VTALTPEQLDAVLPQTQCGLCGYGACMPYAKALVYENAAINLCPPGGVNVLREIAGLMEVDETPYLEEMEKSAKPKLLALIREAECIGCTKCIQACPVDAIIGGAKQMHVVISAECTGCELCVAPCPVDCIDLKVIPVKKPSEEKARAAIARMRYHAREKRLKAEKIEKSLPNKHLNSAAKSYVDKKTFIQQAIQRANQKKFAE
jgi:electron transport complex protein RnfB